MPGGRTLYLIKTLQNIIEDAQEHKKDLFFLFQDIKCVFDLVNLKILIKTLQRIKISQKVIQLITYIMDVQTIM